MSVDTDSTNPNPSFSRPEVNRIEFAGKNVSAWAIPCHQAAKCAFPEKTASQKTHRRLFCRSANGLPSIREHG